MVSHTGHLVLEGLVHHLVLKYSKKVIKHCCGDSIASSPQTKIIKLRTTWLELKGKAVLSVESESGCSNNKMLCNVLTSR